MQPPHNHLKQLRTFLYYMTSHPFVAGSLAFRKNYMSRQTLKTLNDCMNYFYHVVIA